MFYWLHQFLYIASIFAWLVATVLLIREFFHGYRGRIYDDSGLNQHAGPTGRDAEAVPHTAEYTSWLSKRSARVNKLVRLFIVGIALQVMLHLIQTWVVPSFEIMFYTPPTAETMEEMPPEAQE